MIFEGNITSKLPATGTTIFTIMSKMANDHNAINLSQGFPDFSCHPKLVEYVNYYMTQGYNQYAPMAGVPLLRERIAEKTLKLYGTSYDVSNEITITAGATQALQVAMTAFLKENDEVIIFEPAYDSYLPCINLNKARPIYYKMQAPDYKIDWKQVMKLINQKTKMIIINTPHNPTGTVLGREDVLQLERMLKDTDIIVLSDEVYEHIVFDGVVHESVARYEDLRKRSLIVSSFGKTFHTTGWKIGYVLAPENLMAEFRKVFQYAQFSVSTPVQWAIADFLLEPEHYEQLSAFYEAKRNLFASYINQSRFKPLQSHGTYFQCVDYSAVSRLKDKKFVEKLAKENGVAAIPVSAFYKNGDDQKVVRFCFAKNEETLHKAGELLCQI
ncbi:aminotransferase class I/II-fold pyridoxal phosphate-dependent enzyme [bacterium]|nr:aminotransferase class I/II-fold pyridoxal phosphate-dependent enzyme [bacterium]